MIRVIRPGMLTSLQDSGRYGYQRFGIGPGGAMDTQSHRLASALVGNADSLASLECTLTGPTLQFDAPVLLALCGADLSPTIDGMPVPQDRPVLVRAGAMLVFGQRRSGVRCYLALHGGFDDAAVLHSQGTSLRGKFGGHAGRALQKGDVLRCKASDTVDFYPELSDLLVQSSAPFVAPRWKVPGLVSHSTQVVRIMEGRHWPLFSEAARQKLLTLPLRISEQSDRMGYRLEGATLKLENAGEMISEAVSSGTVQVPPDGHPIILMADHGTTGGYPKIAQVASVDLPRLAQMPVHDHLHFELVSLELAQQLYLQREHELTAICGAIGQRRLLATA